MKLFKLSPEAVGDIRDIWGYIGKDSSKAAGKVRLSLLDACKPLAANPAIGHSREDLTNQPILFWPVGSYLIIYDPRTKPLAIVRASALSRNDPSARPGRG